MDPIASIVNERAASLHVHGKDASTVASDDISNSSTNLIKVMNLLVMILFL